MAAGAARRCWRAAWRRCSGSGSDEGDDEDDDNDDGSRGASPGEGVTGGVTGGGSASDGPGLTDGMAAAALVVDESEKLLYELPGGLGDDGDGGSDGGGGGDSRAGGNRGGGGGDDDDGNDDDDDDDGGGGGGGLDIGHGDGGGRPTELLQLAHEAARHLGRALEGRPDASVFVACLAALLGFAGRGAAGRRLLDNFVAANGGAVDAHELRLHWLQRSRGPPAAGGGGGGGGAAPSSALTASSAAARGAAAAALLRLDAGSTRGASELQHRLRAASGHGAASAAASAAAGVTAPAGVTLAEAVQLAAAHVEVRRAEPRAWHLLADALHAAAADGGDDGSGAVAAWWEDVRAWWGEACFHDAAPATAGAEQALRRERLRCARALQTALGDGAEEIMCVFERLRSCVRLESLSSLSSHTRKLPTRLRNATSNDACVRVSTGRGLSPRPALGPQPDGWACRHRPARLASERA